MYSSTALVGMVRYSLSFLLFLDLEMVVEWCIVSELS